MNVGNSSDVFPICPLENSVNPKPISVPMKLDSYFIVETKTLCIGRADVLNVDFVAQL